MRNAHGDEDENRPLTAADIAARDSFIQSQGTLGRSSVLSFLYILFFYFTQSLGNPSSLVPFFFFFLVVLSISDPFFFHHNSAHHSLLLKYIRRMQWNVCKMYVIFFFVDVSFFSLPTYDAVFSGVDACAVQRYILASILFGFILMVILSVREFGNKDSRSL